MGLIPKPEAVTLGAFLDAVISNRTDVKGPTQITYGNARRNLVGYFGEDKPLRDVNHGDADSFRLWLLTDQELSDNTVRRRLGIARQFFRVAVRRKLISENPFDGLATSVRGNPSKFRFVTHDESARIIEACPDSQWRLLFALSRYGGSLPVGTPRATLGGCGLGPIPRTSRKPKDTAPSGRGVPRHPAVSRAATAPLRSVRAG